MGAGLLETKEKVRIRLAENKEITTADDAVFEAQHQEEARMMIFEGDFLKDHLEGISTHMLLGKPQFVVVTEVGRQTTFRYDRPPGRTILLTRAHQGIEELLKESE